MDESATAPAAAAASTLRALGSSLALLAISLLATGGLVFAVWQQGQDIERQHKRALAQQADTRARLARAHEDEKEIREKIARFQTITAQGRVQPERRLDWVEALRNIRETRRLPGLDYEIRPQRPLDDKNPASGGYDFLASPMRLEMPLLHEDDLLGLLADLSGQVQALISVRQCSIQRLPPEQTKPNAASLRASCELDWITLREKA